MWVQLKNKQSIRNAIASITAALVGASPVAASDQNRAETSFLLYKERDRVTAGEGVLGVNKQLNSNYAAAFRLTYDGLTGATPNGAAPSRKAQTFTGPSARSTIVVQRGNIPLDDGFHDTRLACDASLSRLLGRVTTMSIGGHGSIERDYSSVGLNSGLTQDFNQKNTTLGLSGSYSHDVVTPVGGPPTPFASKPNNPLVGGEDDGREGRRSPKIGRPKEVYDLVFGVSQIIDRKTIFRMNYSYDRSKGYQNDPYKIITVVQGPD